jgi:hypothetical protein
MWNENQTTEGPAAGMRNTRLPARVFYGFLVLGMLGGCALTLSLASGRWHELPESRLWLLVLLPAILGSGLIGGGLIGWLGAFLFQRVGGRRKL